MTATLPLNPPGCAPGERLDAELRRQAVPILGVVVTVPPSGPRVAAVHYDATATDADRTRGDSIAAGFDLRDAQLRSLTSIYQAVQALTTAQHANVWADLTAATATSPRKYLDDYGPNAAAIFVMDWIVYVLRPTAAQLTAAQNDVISFVVQDEPLYLVNPTFDPSINLPGYLLVG
jgi:hypothetical protein